VTALLIEQGLRVNARDRQGNTPLRRARFAKHEDVVALLEREGGRD
jgi:ankyrin repeat protein